VSQSPNNVLDAQLSLIFFAAGSADPSIVPTGGSKGTLYVKAGNAPALFQKQDDGVSTNWSPVGGGGGGGANTALSNLITTALNKDLIFNTGLGFATIRTQDAATSDQIYIYSGNASAGDSGLMWIYTGDSATGDSGDLNLATGAAPLGLKGAVVIGAPVLSLPSGNVDPSTAYADGSIYFNLAASKIKFLQTGVWSDVGGTAPTSVPAIKNTYVAGETFEAGKTFVVRLENSNAGGLNAGKVYKHAGQAFGEIAFGFAQNPGGVSILAGQPIDVYQYGPMELLAGDPDLGGYSPGCQVFIGTAVGSWNYYQDNKVNPTSIIGEFITRTKIFVAPFNRIPANSISDAQIYLREGQTLRAWNSLFGGTFYDLLRMNSAQKLCFSMYPYNENNLTQVAVPLQQETFAADLVATTSITQADFPVIDGVTPVDGTRVLCVAQASAVQNGVWRARAGNWARVTDLDYGPVYFRGLDIYVRPGGTSYGNTTWRLSDSNATTPIIGTSTLVFTCESTVYYEGTSVGGAATETLVVTGLAATDTILSVSQRVPGANPAAFLGWANQAADALDVTWPGDPGAGAIIRVAVRKG